MTEVFQQLAAGTFNTEQIWKMARRSGLKTSKNNFWVAIRNPVYCGKIFIPPYKDEAGYFVKGVHEIIISESLFDQAQQSLDGDLEESDFKMIKEQAASKTEELEKKLNSLQGREKEISVLPEKALKNLSGLDLLCENGTIEEKRKILGSIFPEKLTFDGVQHQTTRINEVLNLIYQKNSELNGNKKGTNLLFSDLSHQVIRWDSNGTGRPARTHTLKPLYSNKKSAV